MNRETCCTLKLLTFAIVFLVLCTLAAAQDPRPNLMLIVVDDIGWGELGFQGARDIPTPNIDRIANRGVRFAQAYVSAPICAPSRAGFLTGRYQTRFGFEFHNTVYRHGIPDAVPTIADLLKDAGYETMAIGKWGVGQRAQYAPTERGFDEFFGTTQNTTYYFPRWFVDSRRSTRPFDVTDASFYTTSAYAGRAVEWLKARDETPWFLYLSFNAAHAPLEPPPLGIYDLHTTRAGPRALFRATIGALDAAIGSVLDQLDDMGASGNTLIVLLSDNGGPTWETTSRNGGLRGQKSDLYEGGIRVPMCMRWQGELPEGVTYRWPVSALDIAPTFAAAAGVELEGFDGVNLITFLTGQANTRPHKTLYWRMGPQWAVRDGDWKLVAPTAASRKPRLYHLAIDPGERRDLATRDPAKVRRLQSLFDSWSARQATPMTPQ